MTSALPPLPVKCFQRLFLKQVAQQELVAADFRNICIIESNADGTAVSML